MIVHALVSCGEKTEQTTAAPETTLAPETSGEPETTKAPETTEEPETTKAPETTEEPETTKAPETTEEPETTKAPATTEEPTPVIDPDLYVDINFSSDGKISDTRNVISFRNVGTALNISDQQVTLNGNTITLAGLHVTAEKSYVACVFNELNASALSKLMDSDYTVEATYVNKAKNGAVQGIVCGTQAGGFGIAEDKSGIPYYIASYSGKYISNYGKSASSSTELTHVAVTYTAAEKKITLYINGVNMGSAAVSGTYTPATSGSTQFCLGADNSGDSLKPDFPMKDFIITDAKIYTRALTEADVNAEYITLVGLFN